MRGLQGKVAFVTGAASGIGRATAIRLAEEGARVAAADLNSEGVAATAATIGGDALGVGMDVTDFAGVRAAVEEAERKLGPIDVLVNCAGWDKIEPFVENSEETWDRVIEINLKGVIRCTRAVLDGMIDDDSGLKGRVAGKSILLPQAGGRRSTIRRLHGKVDYSTLGRQRRSCSPNCAHFPAGA